MTWQQEQHGSGPLHHSCSLGEVVMEIYPLKPEVTASTDTSTMLGFQVDSLEQTLASLAALGCEPKTPPKSSDWGLWVNVVDFDGRVVQLNQVTAH